MAGDTYADDPEESDSLILSGLDLLQWLARWGLSEKLELDNRHQTLSTHCYRSDTRCFIKRWLG